LKNLLAGQTVEYAMRQYRRVTRGKRSSRSNNGTLSICGGYGSGSLDHSH